MDGVEAVTCSVAMAEEGLGDAFSVWFGLVALIVLVGWFDLAWFGWLGLVGPGLVRPSLAS